LQHTVEDRQGESGGFAGSGLGDADHVAAGKGEGNGLGLDGRGSQVVLFLERTRDGIGKSEILKGGQKLVLSIKKQAPDMVCRERARVSQDTRVFGASVL
jgi:hypothetical protein